MPDFDSKYAVLVANAEQGEVIVDRVLELDDPILGSGRVGRISDRQVARNLLLHGDTSPRKIPGSSQVGIDSDAADPEESLDSPGHLARKGLGKQRAGAEGRVRVARRGRHFLLLAGVA